VIRFLCGEVKKDCVSLSDVLAPADNLLFSPIGLSNGESYKNLYNTILTTPQSINFFFFFSKKLNKKINKISFGKTKMVERIS